MTGHIITFGCQMNVADSEAMAGILKAEGIDMVDDPHKADLVIINTCSIRKKAEEKAYSQLGRLLPLKNGNGERPLIIFAGCVAKKEGQKLLERFPDLDVIMSPSRISRLMCLVEKRLDCREAVIDVAEGHAGAVSVEPVRESGIKAFINIIHGCDNHCAYCVVPLVRGPEMSRLPEDIQDEVLGLVDKGYREVTLLGQNVNSYGKGLRQPIDFPRLLEILDGTGIDRIRFTTSHPKDFNRKLARAIRNLPSVCEALHLPVQAGSDRILKAMNRGYSSAEYREKVQFMREAVPEVKLSTDVIVGFPGEGEEDFEETVRLLEDIRFSGIFAFKYSSREGTPAADFPETVSEEEKSRRLQIVLDLQKDISLLVSEAEVGREKEVLIEGPSKTGEGMMTGRTRGNLVVNFHGRRDLAGQILPVLIVEARMHSLIGRLFPADRNN